VKLLEENIGINLHKLELGNGFLAMTSNKQHRKNRSLGLHQSENQLCFKGYCQESEKTTHKIGEIICKLYD